MIPRRSAAVSTRSGHGQPRATSSGHSARSTRCHQPSVSKIRPSSCAPCRRTGRLARPLRSACRSSPRPRAAPTGRAGRWPRRRTARKRGSSPARRPRCPGTSGGRSRACFAMCAMHLDHAAGVRGRACDDSLSPDGLGEGPLHDAVVGDCRAEEVSAYHRHRWRGVHPIASLTQRHRRPGLRRAVRALILPARHRILRRRGERRTLEKCQLSSPVVASDQRSSSARSD